MFTAYVDRHTVKVWVGFTIAKTALKSALIA